MRCMEGGAWKACAARALDRIAWSSPGQTFVLFPLLTVAFEMIRRRGRLRLDRRFLPLLGWGYAEHRLCRRYRDAHGGGGPGISRPPERLVTTGLYALSRNPMYLGHLVFTAGLALALRSPLALGLLAERVARFSERVRVDEERLERQFGDEYRAYKSRAKRWVPGLW